MHTCLSTHPFLRLPRRGCETWVVREGYEGLVRGNDENVHLPPYDNTPMTKGVTIADPDFLKTLRFGDGTLLRDGTFDHSGGRSLKGRYIIRVGWDDVRGYLPQVSSPLCRKGSKLTRCCTLGRNLDRHCEV